MVKSKKAALELARSSGHKKTREVTNNPFEIHTNRRKHDILGRKLKHDKGLPGISRSKAIKKRQKTLLVEHKQKNKANMFIDRRFGEYDEKMSLEEKMLKRFTMEKKHHHDRHGKYRLEDEELTHLGQSLGDIDKFEDVQLSDDDDDDDMDKSAEADHVRELHFGGFLTKKRADDEQTSGKHKSKKEIMEEVVAKAKIKKHERQMAKEETITLTDKLDQDWKNVKNLISLKRPHTEEVVSKVDDYDIAVKQLAFEIKGKATDRLKSEHEIAKEEQERLEKLELERQRRMRGLPAVAEKPKHISADDLGDSFTPAVDERFMLSYQDGSVHDMEDEEDEDQIRREAENSDEESEVDGKEEEEEEGDNSAAGDDNDDDDDDDEEDQDSESCEDDNGSDLESDVSNDGMEDESDSEIEIPGNQQQQQNNVQKEKTEAEVVEPTKEELPFTFKAPKSLQEFKELIKDWSFKQQLTIIDRIKACHNPKITPANKPKMEVLFTILLDYVGELSQMGPEGIKMIDELSRHLFDVSQYSPVHSAKCMQQIVEDIHKKFTQNCDKQGKSAYASIQLRLNDVSIFTAQLVLPFKHSSKWRDLLKLQSDSSSLTVKPLPLTTLGESTADVQTTDETRVNSVNHCLSILQKFVDLYQDLPASFEIFAPVKEHLQRIPSDLYPASVQEIYRNLQTRTNELFTKSLNRNHLTLQARKPEPIKTYEPKFEEHYEVRSRRGTGNKATNEKQKLRYKYKREFKGAIREIRKDNQFLAKQKLKEQLERDTERLRKVKQIEHMLSNQQAETNAMNRKKRKRGK
ncbi:nucleolar protein 14-like [Pocillopora damicornis]|uniref:nucleolar protein 14-like n=1 Tax=Pocillopora damicornis TaxID=46731 RepID=UPI000F559145|nr:nucleolar protein 14-like [Pocillopora damicornis]